ncbi:hypothetical protein ABZ725_30910 [Streptomyces sp. NPDC006872]|uniref:hypothetical protein n=1 Tax=Streptomyces sp. NPDC006872 TaxID=3155720 RepID=UPI0033F01163
MSRSATPGALARGLLIGALVGASSAILVVGVVLERGSLLVVGLALAVVLVVIGVVVSGPRRAREAAVPRRTALAMIESLRADSTESGDVPISFELTVAPDDAPAFRVQLSHNVNLVDLPDYRPRGILVVEYPADRPWRTGIVKRPTPEWKSRAADALIDSAPESALVRRPPEEQAFRAGFFVGLLLGAAAVLLPFRADLTGPDGFGSPAASEPSVSSSSSSSSSSTTVTSTSVSGTVSVGPDRSLLDEGELRRAVEALTKGKDENAARAITVVVQERLLTVVFAPAGAAVPQFDLDALPYARIPALVREATKTLGAGSPGTWQLTADHLTNSLALRVTVTGPDGAASLDADGAGKIVRRSPAQ